MASKAPTAAATQAAPVVAPAPAAEPPVVKTAPVVEAEPEALVEDEAPFSPEPGFGQGASQPEPVEVAETDDGEAPFVPAPGFGHAEDLEVVEQPDPALTAQDGSFAPRDPEFEAKATALNAELAASLVPMSHPDDATCDAYATNKAGNILVPASEAAAMESLGFAVVADG